MSSKSDEISLGDYLLERLAQLNVKSIFGVPGDFNLGFLDLIEASKLDWIGCTNELNAAYAADGYARVEQSVRNNEENGSNLGGVKGIGAVLTTFGVGELSAMNGIAGAFAERVPVLHIVGVPSTKLQSQKALLHHTLGDGTFKTYFNATSAFVAASTFLTSADGAVDEIDRVISSCLETAKPGYIALPTDLVNAVVSRANLAKLIVPPSISTSHKALGSKDGEEKELLDFATKEIVRLWNSSKKPIILVDACTIRYGVQHLVNELIEKTGAMYFTTPMGKSACSEELSTFGGVYSGAVSHQSITDLVDQSDLVILIGGIRSDFNSGSFSYSFGVTQTIELHSDHALIQFGRFEIGFHTLLPALIKNLDKKELASVDNHNLNAARAEGKKVPAGEENEMVTQAAFWPLIGSFLRPNDIIVTETGTSSFGFLPVSLPSGSIMVSQVLWGSIGWSVGALLGSAVAARESGIDRRVLLFVGDGSIQLTATEISTMIRQGLKPIVFILNNDGYVIERLIHGETAVYNDIAPWNFQTLLSTLYHPIPSSISGGKLVQPIPTISKLAKTRKDLIEILEDDVFSNEDCMRLVEVRMARLDGPVSLQKQAKESARLNSE